MSTIKNEVIKPAAGFSALDFIKGALKSDEQLNKLVVSINEERVKLGNKVTINANQLRENLMDLSKSLHNQLAGHLDKWIQYGLTVEPANRLPQAA
jgi:hypothetical protein